MIERLSIRTAVSAEAQRNIETTFGVECEILPNGVDVKVFADAEPWPAPSARPCCSSGATSRARGSACCSTRSSASGAIAPSIGPSCGSRGRGPRPTSCGSGACRACSGSVASPSPRRRRRLRAATVACFPSTEGESFGVVLLEAMAAGTAIVASDLSGYREVARVDREALLVEPGGPDGAARRADAPR